MTETYGWAPILKFEKNDDGTAFVTGRVSDSGLDRDEQVCDQAWLDRAVPTWFGEGGNVREQHDGKRAVGVAVEHWKADDGGHHIRALVADPVAVMKVEHKILKGFSIGIKNARVTKSAQARNGAIVDGSIIEVSLVDRPANPSCLVEIAKSDDSGGIAPVPVEEQRVIESSEEIAKAEPVEPETVVTQVIPDELQAALDEIKTITADYTKSDGDVAAANDAIACIANLIQSEATSLAAGDLKDAGDIAVLLDAISALRYFIMREQDEDGQEIDLSDTPEETKDEGLSDDAATLTPSTTDPAEPDTGKADGLDFEAIVTKALDTAKAEFEQRLAKANEVHEESLRALRAELEKANSLPVPGGPVRVRLSSDRIKADQADRADLLTKADEYDRLALSEQDPRAAQGYRDLAADLRSKAR